MRGGPRPFHQGFTCPDVLRIPSRRFRPSPTGLSPSPAGFPKTLPLGSAAVPTVHTPECSHSGLASSHFARRYSGNRFFFLFLRLLRCFSSPGSPPRVMDSRADARGPPVRVSPFRHPRINGHVPLPAAFRSLSRLSSAPGAKASALCPFCLTSGPRAFTPAPCPEASGHGFFVSACCFFISRMSRRVVPAAWRGGLCMKFSRYSSRPFSFQSGSRLLSRAVSSTVSSAARALTVVFGMGTGVSPGRIAAGCLFLPHPPLNNRTVNKSFTLFP